MTGYLGQSIIILTRTVTGEDAYGNDVYSETSLTVTGAFNPGMSSELVQGQDLVTMQPTIYLDAGVALSPTDAVSINGDRYEVDGTPDVWDNPFTGSRPGLVAKLKRVTG